jgi:hypothetical protein
MKRVKDSKLCEKFARKKGYINLEWLCPEHVFKKGNWEKANARYVLYGRPKDYSGEYSDYNEPIIAEIRNKNYLKLIGYKWALAENSFGVVVGKFVMN